ncbi:hypothetical protein Pfo_026802 [Paulownia fortunei]|nr:hypothetical protein Pfo_026802 [Paulownia fortunei]
MPNCIHCGVVRFGNEPLTFYCDNEKIKLALFEIPDELYELFIPESEVVVETRGLHFSSTGNGLKKCKYHYPQSYCESTIQGKDGCAIYKRRKNGLTIQVQNAQLNNKWVVTYNPYLLSIYNCHINIEICIEVRTMKYIYKYIYKGHDRVAIHLTHNDDEHLIDEIKYFQDARWVSAQEYFSICSKRENARKYLYKEFPEHFFSMILNCIQKGNGGFFLIDRLGGTKKAFLNRAFLVYLRSKNLIGRTVYSHFKLPINTNGSSDYTMLKQSGAVKLLCKHFDKLLKDVTRNNEDFGEKMIVFCGDYRQVQPVLVEIIIVAQNEKKYIILSKNMRSRNDLNFSEFLLRVGNGEEPIDIDGNIKISEQIIIKISEDMIIEYDNEENSIQRLIRAIFLTLHKSIHSPYYMTSRTILTAKHEHIDSLNDKLIFIFPEKVQIFNIFSHNHLYVALSNKTSMSTTKVLIKPDIVSIRGKRLTKYTVYK